MNNEKNDRNTLSTVITAAKIIEFIGSNDAVTPAGIARALQLNRSNVHRLLATLMELGYVEEGPYSSFKLTFKIFELGNNVPYRKMLIDIARPSMLRLAQLTGHTVNNAVIFENEVLYIDKVEANTYLKLDRSVGRTDPIHSTSLGKVLLAFEEPDVRETILSELKFIPSTPNTITDIDLLRTEIERVRESGYGLDQQELSMDLVCVAAPVFNCRGRISSAVSVSGPADRFTIQDAEKIVPDIKATCREITRRMCREG